MHLFLHQLVFRALDSVLKAIEQGRNGNMLHCKNYALIMLHRSLCSFILGPTLAPSFPCNQTSFFFFEMFVLIKSSGTPDTETAS